jgi:glycosyltransferase involved in cell wall biosynthesis
MHKICHITTAHNQRDIRIFIKECSFLAKCPNYEVYLVAPGESAVVNNVNIIGLGDKPSSRIKRSTVFAGRAKRLALSIEADLYHLHDPELLSFAKSLKKTGARVVFDSHEDTYNQILLKDYIPKGARNLAANIYKRTEVTALKYIDAVIFPCDMVGGDPFKGRSKRLIYLDNLPILKDHAAKPVKSNIPTVCCPGSLSEARGIEQLIIGSHRAGAKLILAGNFASDSFRDKLLSLNEFQDVDYRGVCDQEEIGLIYAESDIGASTILPEGQYPLLKNLPTKVYEYMMNGLPFIISDFPYCRYFVDKYKCGLTVDPKDPDDIAAAIYKLVSNPKLADDMGVRGREIAKHKFNWQMEVKKLYMLYDDLLMSE